MGDRVTAPSAGGSIGLIRKAVKAQIETNLNRETTVYAYGQAEQAYPCIEILPAQGEAVGYFKTFGDGGLGDLRLDLHIYTTAADPVSAQIALDDYLSIGGDNQSSVVDAILVDRTLGGVVEDCVPLVAIYGPLGANPATAVIPLQIIFRKDARA